MAGKCAEKQLEISANTATKHYNYNNNWNNNFNTNTWKIQQQQNHLFMYVQNTLHGDLSRTDIRTLGRTDGQTRGIDMRSDNVS